MRICVYGAAMEEIAQQYKTKTEEFGRCLVMRGHSLVYGGGAKGLMGAAARGVKEKGGYIVGIAPSFFDVDGELFEDCDEFLYPDTMRERKRLLEEKSDAFVILPGGIGTFDEFFETLVLRSLGRLKKPIAVYNIDHYYDALQQMMEHSVKAGFVPPDRMEMYKCFDDAQRLLRYLEQGLSL